MATLSSKVEGGVRGVNCGSDRIGQGSVEAPHGGLSEGDLEGCQAQQAGIHVAGQLEEDGSPVSEEFVRGHVPSVLSETSGRPLDSNEEGSIDGRTGSVSRRQTSRCSRRPIQCRGGTPDSEVSGMQYSYDVADQQVDQRTVLRVLQVPSVQKHPTMQVCGKANPRGPGRDDGSRTDSQATTGDQTFPKQDSQAGGGLWRSIRRFVDASSRCRLGRGRSESQRHDLQCELVGRRDGNDREDAIHEGEEVKSEADGNCMKEPLDSTVREKLSSDEVERRIRRGNHKRAQLKKGVIRRCLGNLRNIVAATCLMAAASVGVAAAKIERLVGVLGLIAQTVWRFLQAKLKSLFNLPNGDGTPWSLLIRFMVLTCLLLRTVKRLSVGLGSTVLGLS